MNRFCFISKRSDFESISKYWKIRNFLKKSMISKKKCIAMLPTLALIEIRRKRLDLMKNRVSFSI